MKVFCCGKEITLKDSEFLASGGEGSVYKKSNVIYKIYNSQIDKNKEKKLKDLSILSKSNIISPKDILYSNKGEPVGYTMPFVSNSSSLALLFTKTFKERNNINSKHLENIFLNMSETIQYIHEKDILIVDCNELNFLISNSDWSTPYFIDVDGYQTKDSPTTAIMPSIQDFLYKDFTRNSDFYSFAVLMFQLYTGIHPYKGNHPKYKKDDIESRCKDKVSVFNKDVKYPPFVNLNSIPSNLTDWFIQVFEKGERLLPPNLIINNAPAPQIIRQITQGLKQISLQVFDENIQCVMVVNGKLLVVLERRYYYDKYYFKNYTKEIPIVFDNTIYSVTKTDNRLVYYDGKNDVGLDIPNIEKITCINNRLFVITDEQLLEFEINKFTKKLVIKTNWNILASASTFFANCLYTNSFGKALFYIPEIKDNTNVVYVCKVQDLDNHKIIDCYYENGTLISISMFKRKYCKTVIKFNSTFTGYDYIQNDCTLQEINAAVLANGMSLVFDDDTLELSSRFSTNRKIIDAQSDLHLTHRGNDVLGFKDKELFSLSMK